VIKSVGVADQFTVSGLWPALPADESQLIFTSARDTSKFDKKKPLNF